VTPTGSMRPSQQVAETSGTLKVCEACERDEQRVAGSTPASLGSVSSQISHLVGGHITG
jgi:hypothetical protein